MHELDQVAMMMSLAFLYTLSSLQAIYACYNLQCHLALSELHCNNGASLPDVNQAKTIVSRKFNNSREQILIIRPNSLIRT